MLCVNATSGTISMKLRPRSWPATLPDFSSNEILMSCTTRLLDQEIFRLIGGYRFDNLVEYSYSIPEDTSYGLKLSFRETEIKIEEVKSGWFLESERKLGFHFAWNQMEIGWEKSFKIIWWTVNWSEFLD